jgi:5-methylcytosine-specific restriction protein A
MAARGGLRVCTTPTCPVLVSSGRCSGCAGEAEAKRGNATKRGYDAGHRAFRRKVLRRDPICVLCGIRPSTDADHWPVDRRTLELRGEDPNDPKHGRGLCSLDHKRETAANQPGGFNTAS